MAHWGLLPARSGLLSGTDLGTARQILGQALNQGDILMLWSDAEFETPKLFANEYEDWLFRMLDQLNRSYRVDRALDILAGKLLRDGRPDGEILRALAEKAVLSRYSAQNEVSQFLKNIARPKPIPTDKVEPGKIAVAEEANRATLERLLKDGGGIMTLNGLFAKLSTISSLICRIEATQLGTGFLVAPDLVLTNYHVVKPEIDSGATGSAKCRFDYLSDEEDGVEVKLHAQKPFVAFSKYAPDEVGNASSPQPGELDYALLRLESPLGDAPSPKSAGKPRGFIRLLPDMQPPGADKILFVMQHPAGRALSTSLGLSLGTFFNGMRLRYTADTEAGSSGSPVFDQNLKLIALHHVGDPGSQFGGAAWNQGVPVSKIVAHIKDTVRDVNLAKYLS
ncbi:hypothetical protein AMST5_00103 [freshwater sediment metagenome]|uniref:Serine protease n=1 Tax=freshwater sediment metagenome TaxID=556182 RepID=A0AA48LXD8_9ZZZZ